MFIRLPKAGVHRPPVITDWMGVGPCQTVGRVHAPGKYHPLPGSQEAGVFWRDEETVDLIVEDDGTKLEFA
jgi:hypothetical protein